MPPRLLILMIAAAVFHSSPSAAQKRIYIPEDLRTMDLDSDTSQWCWKRSAETRDVIFMWERGFGSDLQAPPALEGRPMAFNLPVLMERVQSFYTFFRDTLGWMTPTNLPTKGEAPTNLTTKGEAPTNLPTKGAGPSAASKADRYKMMVMVNYSLEGTAYGGTYDNFIGALWVAPNRIQDKTMNCMAHELGHSFQSQIMADSIGDCWGGNGFFEMTSQWMLWQVNPWWLRDENYHFEAFKTLTHKAFLAMDNIYHSPYVIQWWSDLHGRQSIAELFRQGRIGEDPVMTYQRMYGLSQRQFCEELFLGYQHLVNIDFHHAWQETRPYAGTWQTPLDTLRGGWLQPKNTLEDYGFHIIPLPAGHKGGVKVRGNGLLWTIVGIDDSGRSVYDAQKRRKAPVRKFLVVMAAPETHRQLRMHPGGDDAEGPNAPRLYPYSFRW